MQCPEATRVAGFHAWLRLGYCVRKGERAIRIWLPMPPSKARLERWRAHGANQLEEPELRFRLGPVFDRSQVGPLPPPASPLPLDPPIVSVEGDELVGALVPLVSLAGEIGCTVAFEPLRRSRAGSFDVDSRRIVVSTSLSANGQVKTLIHELAHALARTDRDCGDPRHSYAAEELIVESVAFTVCGSLGIDTAGYSIPYLASWAETAGAGTLERYAAMIDRLARQLEEATKDVLVSGGELVLAAPVVPV